METETEAREGIMTKKNKSKNKKKWKREQIAAMVSVARGPTLMKLSPTCKSTPMLAQ